DSIGPRSRSTPCSAGTSAPVPRVESPIASVLRRIVSELLLIASVFCRTVVATEQPAVIAAATTIAGMRLIFISPQSRSAKAFALPPRSRSAKAFALPPQSRSAKAFALPPQSRSAKAFALPPQSRSAESVALPRSRFRSCSASLSGERGVALRVGDDNVGGLLTDHVDRADDEQSGHVREDRRVDDAKPFGAVHLEVAAQHAAAIPR